jgi:NodT family efflux transporter outer membrane factor (OMF) lipoprotein
MKPRVMAWMLLLGGCTVPDRLPKAAATLPVPPDWRNGAAREGEIDPRWWTGFGDAALDALIEQARGHNNDLLAAAARVQEARAGFRLAAGQARPSLSLEGQSGAERTLDALGVGLDQRFATASVTAAYEIDLFHRLSAATEAARARLLAQQATRDAVALAVTAAVAEGYVGLCVLDAKRAVAESTLSARQRQSALVHRRAASGYSSQLERAQADAELEAAARLVPAIERAIAQQENALAVLTGSAPGPSLHRGALEALRLPEVPVALPSELLRQRPDLAAAEAALAATDKDLDAARAAFLPRIRLQASSGAIASTAIANPVTLFLLGGSVLAPLFEGGKLRAEQEGAAARRDAAAFAYRRAVLGAFAEVENALAASATLAREEGSARRQRDALEEAYAIAEARTRAGYDAALDRLIAQRSLLDAQLALVEVHGARLQAAVALYRSVGGGWRR